MSVKSASGRYGVKSEPNTVTAVRRKNKMPEACAVCGSACVKTRGTYRELCPDCMEEEARNTRHVEQCNSNDCVVCDDRLQELQTAVQPLFVRTLLERDTAPNQKLTEYT